MKRTFDFILALSGLAISMPLWLIFGLAIWLEDRVSIFYFQDRVGKDGKIFRGIKFRSMVAKAEKGVGPVQARENDPRVTKIGKWLRHTAMDELPQLINILRGEMSFVGPRALRPEEKEVEDNIPRSIFDYPDFKERIKVTPGLTGVAQVFAPRDVSRQKKFKYDLWYIKNHNFFLDIYLIMLSFLITLRTSWEIRKDKFIYLARGLKQKIETDITGL